MKTKYIELRTRSSFGAIIDSYFSFLKYNFKDYINLYLRYNALSVIFVLLSSYLLVTGFMGLASRDFRFGMGSDTTETQLYLGLGAILLALIYFITALINYSFSSAYITQYVKTGGNQNSKDIWDSIKINIGNIFLFILLGILIYIGYFIVSLVLAFIPIVGTLVQYAISFILSAMFGIAFMAIFSNNLSTIDALKEGWEFSINNFLKVIGYSFVIGVLNLMITALILAIPGFILSIYIYFSAESNIDILTSNFASILFTISFAIFLLSFIFSQALSQLAYGVLFYNLHEEKYNTFLQSKIDLIGKDE
ncbi:hypothetical protein [Lacinutrix sp. Bg11-31]|uniref:hypothetical protein n=1 Tax=Lacinutrix sp. Bg11-31 TaxID=2057808 RepID=UPI000C30C23F|nr:hypothetical protein [Lacinutrix sp. Bg11-31]AUC80929.1 hypothetical protein CW733_01785 [Lacinutrix sp. Bg11-31]